MSIRPQDKQRELKKDNFVVSIYRTLSKTLCRLVKSEQVKSTSFLPEGGVGEHPHNITQGKKDINMIYDIDAIKEDYYKRYERFMTELLKSHITFMDKAELLEKMDQDMQEKIAELKEVDFAC